MVQRTVGDDLFWSPPTPLPAAGSLVSVDDAAQILAFGPGRIGVVWTSRAEGAVYLSSHGDGEPDTTWSAPEPAVSGRGLASNQMRAIAAPDGRLYVTVRTSLNDDPAAGGQSPQVLVLARSDGAVWTSALYGRIQDQLGSPLLSLDPDTSILYVMATSPKPGGAIVYKRSPADHPMFAPGAGNPFIVDPAAPQTGSGTTGRDPVGAATGLVVLAWDPTSSRYVHGVMDLGRGVAAGPLPAAGTKPGPQLAFEDDFDPWIDRLQPEHRLGAPGERSTQGVHDRRSAVQDGQERADGRQVGGPRRPRLQGLPGRPRAAISGSTSRSGCRAMPARRTR